MSLPTERVDKVTRYVGGTPPAIDRGAGAYLWDVDGRQYVVVPTGWGGWVEGFLPAMLSARAGSAVFAFALPE